MLRSKVMFAIWSVYCIFYYILSDSTLAALPLIITVLLGICLAVEAAAGGTFVTYRLGEITDGRKYQKVMGHLLVKSRFWLPIAKMSVFFSFQNVLTGEKKQCRCSLSLKARGEDQIQWEFCSGNCGKIQLKIEKVIYYDFLGIFRRRTYPKLETSYLVLPELFPAVLDISSRNAANMDSDVYSDSKKGYDSSETFNIREYMPGDHTKFIHWKLSSKTEQVLIRELGFPIQNTIQIFLETGVGNGQRDYDCIDTMLEIFVSFSHALCRQNYPHTLVWYSTEEGDLKEFYIQEESDIFQLLDSLLSTTFQMREESVISRYLKERHDISAAHIVYITDTFEEEEVVPLMWNSCVTVLKDGRSGSEQEQRDTAYTVIAYHTQDLRQELGELSI